MLISFALSFLLWSGLSLYRHSNGYYFHWREPPKFLIVPLILIFSLLSTLLPDFHQPFGFANEGRMNYFPLSYPLGVNWFTSQNMKMSNWFLWFLTPELGLTFSLPGYIYVNIILVNLLLSFCFFLVNYFFTISLLNLLSSHVMKSSDRQSKIVN